MSDEASRREWANEDLPEEVGAGMTGDVGPLLRELASEEHVAAEERIGSRIGPYRLLQRIGEGGFGAVFMAEQEEPVRRRVALKIVKLGMDTRQVVARFEQERQALALMDHPNIAKVFDAGSTSTGRPYFVMELCTGDPITVYCDRNNLTIRERLELHCQVCLAVQHAHQKGVIHRDLKPSNILVATQDGRAFAKVIDFGVAKATSSRLTEKTLFTELRQLIGTPEYMSPEQAEGSLDIDTRADVYSLGVVLYELLTGSTPFDSSILRAASYAEMQRIIREVEPPKPSTRLSTAGAQMNTIAARRRSEPRTLGLLLRGELDWIVMKALDKDRARRYGGAGELAADLRRHLDGEAVAAAPPSALYRFRTFIRRHRGGAVAAGLVAAALLLGIAGTGVGLLRAERERAATERALEDSDAILSFLAGMLAAVSPEDAGRDVSMRTVLDEASRTIGRDFKGGPQAEARLRRTIGNAYRGLGELESAAGHLAAAVDLRRGTEGANAPDTLRALGDLAGLRHEQGRYEESVRLGREALAGWKDSGHDATALALGHGATALGLMNNLAQSLLRLGRYEEAVAMQREVVAGMERTLGATHEDTLGSSVNLVTMLFMRREHEEAEAMLLRIAQTWSEMHGPDRPGALFALSELGGFYLNARRPAEAEVVLRDLHERQVRVLGERHPAAVRTQANLGYALLRQGRRSEGRKTLEEAWREMDASLGSGHVDVLRVGAEILSQYPEEEWNEEASARLAPIVAGLGHAARRSDTPANVLNDCAWLLLEVPSAELRDPALALAIARRACDKARAEGDPGLWSYLDTLALALGRNGLPQLAVEAQREALSLLPPSGEEHRGEMEERLREYEEAAGAG